MTDLVLSTSSTRNVTVRQRCVSCEVAWSGPTESPCWVCGETGEPLNAMVVVRNRGLAALEFDLFD